MQKRLLFENIKLALDSSESSESDSDSDLMEIIYNYKHTPRIPKIHCKNYVEDVVWQYTDVDFKSHFR